ncbi:MAG: PIN domain-containing protein [Nitrososphaerales archaeon]
MGLAGFPRICEDSHCEEVPLEALKGERIAFDMNGLGYRLYPSAKKEVIKGTNWSETLEVDHALIEELALKHIIRHLAVYLQAGVQVICCFDSRNHPRKQRVLQKRKEQKEKPREELEKLKVEMQSLQLLERIALTERYQKLLVNHNYIPQEFWTRLQQILSSLGYPVYRAEDFFGVGGNGDGEALAATFCINGHCYAALTNDSDAHMYGCKRCIISSRFEMGTLMLKIRHLDRILATHNCTYSQFLDACILGGTDYNLGVRGIAIKTGLKKLRANNWHIQGLGVDDEEYLEVRDLITSIQIPINPPQLDFDLGRYRALGEETLKFNNLGSLIKLYDSLGTTSQEDNSCPINLEALQLL